MQPHKSDNRTRNSNVYTQMRADILECRVSPGERLRFDDLRKRYDITVGPIREALMRLTSDGLVLLEEHRGFTVAEVSPEQLADITATRREIESLAIRWSIERGDDRWESEVYARYHELAKRDMPSLTGELDMEWERRHRAFHVSLYAACGSTWLSHFCNQLHDHTDRYRRLWFRHFNATRDVIGEHRQIMEAVTQRDVAAASYLIQRHLTQTMNALLELMATKGAEPGSRSQNSQEPEA